MLVAGEWMRKWAEGRAERRTLNEEGKESMDGNELSHSPTPSALGSPQLVSDCLFLVRHRGS